MPYEVASSELAEFQRKLIGTWTNHDDVLLEGKPLSYNVMPLPQFEPQPSRPASPNAKYGGFILKNFPFKETVRFNGSSGRGDPPAEQDPEALAVVAGAPNRGGTYTQISRALFYEQQIRLAEGPENGKIAHVENGAWLHLGSQEQKAGPYGSSPGSSSGPTLRQPPYLTIAKQISVPHGNSVLALGRVDLNDQGKFDANLEGAEANTILSGAPSIPDAFVPYPSPADIATDPYFDPYSTELEGQGDFENPDPASTLNPNLPLQRAIGIIKPTAYMHWHVTTEPIVGGQGLVTNIPFEQSKADVIDYWADYWLLANDANHEAFLYLLYNQTALMRMKISTDGGATEQPYVFPHVTCNAVKKVSGNPTEARAATSTPLE